MNKNPLFEKAGFPSWTEAFRLTSLDYRETFKQSLIKNLCSYGNEYDKEAGQILYNEMKKNTFVGIAPSLFYIAKDSKQLSVLKFKTPQLNFFLKNFPATVIAGADIDSYKKDTVIVRSDMLQWVKNFVKSDKDQRKQMEEILLEGIWRYKRKHENDLDNKAGKELYVTLLSDEVEFFGFGYGVAYFTLRGTEIDKIYVHDQGGATLIYKYVKFPAFIMASPSLRWDNSHIKEVNLNQYHEGVLGFTD